MKKFCAFCQKEFEADRNARYCSKKCTREGRIANQRKRHQKYIRTQDLVCLKCGKTFQPRTKFANERLFCYECQPEYIDTITELPFEKRLEKELRNFK